MRGSSPQTLHGHTGAVLAIDVDPQFNLLVSAAADKTLRLWDVAHERCTRVFYGHGGTLHQAGHARLGPPDSLNSYAASRATSF